MSEAKEAKKPEEAAAHAAPAGKSSKLLPALVGLNSLLLIGVMGFLVMQMRKSSHPPEAVAEASAEKGEAKGEEKAAEGKGEAKGEEKAAEHGKEEKPAKEEGGKEGAKEGEHGGGGTSGGGGKGGLGPLVKIADFVIHLRNPEIDRYARISFDVEVIGDSDKEALNIHMPRVRDAFISYLSDRTLEEMQGAEGLGRTKEALQQRLRDLVPEARVRNLYISDFVVQ